MAFVDRDREGNIVGVYQRPQHRGQEQIANNDAEVVAFYGALEQRPARVTPVVLRDTPGSVTSAPALRDELNALKAWLRQERGYE